MSASPTSPSLDQQQAIADELMDKNRLSSWWRILSLPRQLVAFFIAAMLPTLPIVPKGSKVIGPITTGGLKSFVMAFGAFVVTVGNASACAGMAFLTVSAAMSLFVGPELAVFLGIISLIGTLLAMLVLYGSSVFPESQKVLIGAKEQKEFMALSANLKLAESLGLKFSAQAAMRDFLQRGIDKRRDLRARMELKARLSKTAEELKKLARLDVQALVVELQGKDREFALLLAQHFSENAQVSHETAKAFFNSIYNVESKQTVDLPIFSIEHDLKAFLESKDEKGATILAQSVDVSTAFSEIVSFHQWVRARLRHSKLNHITSDPNWDGVHGSAETFKEQIEYKHLIFKAQERIQKLRSLFCLKLVERVSANAAGSSSEETDDEFYDRCIAPFLNRVRKQTSDAIRQEKALAERLSSQISPVAHYKEGSPPTATRHECEQALQKAWATAEREANNRANIGKWERRLAWVGWTVGLFGAIANAALGFMGLMALITLLGVPSGSLLFWLLIVIGMAAAFGSSFWMTRIRIEERFTDFGRWFDKGLYVEHSWLRGAAIVFALAGAAGPGWLAFVAGKMLALFVLGSGPASLSIGIVFGLICGVATVCASLALMVEGIYGVLLPYAEILQDPHYKGWYKRLATVLRMFFIGHLGDVDRLRVFQFILGRTLGLALLIGAIGSQIQFVGAPILVASAIAGGIAMLAVYCGVFPLAQKFVDKIFDGLRWSGTKLDAVLSKAAPKFELGELLLKPLSSDAARPSPAAAVSSDVGAHPGDAPPPPSSRSSCFSSIF